MADQTVRCYPHADPDVLRIMKQLYDLDKEAQERFYRAVRTYDPPKALKNLGLRGVLS